MPQSCPANDPAGFHRDSLAAYATLQKAGAAPGFSQVLAALKACSCLRDLESGSKIHAELQLDDHRHRLLSSVFLSTSLVDMYAKCGSLTSALVVFRGMEMHNVVSWNCIIQGCAENGESDLALGLFYEFILSKTGFFEPNRVTFLAALKACIALACEEAVNLQKPSLGCDELIATKSATTRALQKTREVHAEAIRKFSEVHLFVGNSLITAYSKCGVLEEALRIFQGMKQHSAVSWTEIIMGFAENGNGNIALELFHQMQQEGSVSPTHVTLLAALKACLALDQRTLIILEGKVVQAQAIRIGLDSHVFVASSMIVMYAECGRLADAQRIFESLVEINVVVWNCLITGYVRSGKAGFALRLYHWMRAEGSCQPDSATFVASLKACLSLLAEAEEAGEYRDEFVEKRLIQGRSIHSNAVDAYGGEDRLPILVANSLLDLYAKCGSMAEAWKVFQEMKIRSLVSWNCIILGYAENGDGGKALELFSRMQSEEEVSPNHVTYLAALKACGSLAEAEEEDDGKILKTKSLEKAREIHLLVTQGGHESHRYIGNALVAVYAKCGSLQDARDVFEGMLVRDLVSWNSMILGYAESGDGTVALELYHRMQDEGVCEADELTYAAATKACSSLAGSEVSRLDAGRAVHAEVIDRDLLRIIFLSNSLIDMYGKCGSTMRAWMVFESMPKPSTVSWNCIILSFVENAEPRRALQLFSEMSSSSSLSLDSVTFAAALRACGSLGDLQAGREIHRELMIAKSGINAALANSLIDFYGKCGCMSESREIFESLDDDRRSLVSWNALLDGYSRQGKSQQVFKVFEEMQRQRVRPNDVTLLCVLGVCSHGGFVEEGLKIFEEMSSKFGVRPTMKHCNCVVDLLGRGNRVEEAIEVVVRSVNEFGESCCVVLWMTLLGACRKWRNVSAGEVAFESLMKSEDLSESIASAAFVLMSNIYAEAGKQNNLFHSRVT